MDLQKKSEKQRFFYYPFSFSFFGYEQFHYIAIIVIIVILNKILKESTFSSQVGSQGFNCECFLFVHLLVAFGAAYFK